MTKDITWTRPLPAAQAGAESVPPYIDTCQRVHLGVESEWREGDVALPPTSTMQSRRGEYSPHPSAAAARSDRPPTIQHATTIGILGPWSLNAASSTARSGASVLQYPHHVKSGMGCPGMLGRRLWSHGHRVSSLILVNRPI